MKIAWFTPFCRASAIGRFSQAATAELAQHCPVDIWTPHDRDHHATSLPVFSISALRDDPEALASYSRIIYNLGDHWLYHGDIFKTLQQTPGIVILHDYVMHHFFLGYYFLERKDPEGYLELLKLLYGPELCQEAKAGLRAGAAIGDTDRVMDYPLFEPCLDHATAAIVMSSFFERALSGRAMCPVGRLFLPHFQYNQSASKKGISASGKKGDCPSSAKGQSPFFQDALRDELGVPPGKLLLLTVGMLNPNKRIDVTLEVLGRDRELANRVHYVIIGSPTGDGYQKKLQDLIQKHGLEAVVRLLGHQPEEVLHQYLSCADVCINLRNPTMEGASASLVEALHFGRPTIVTDAGCYRDFPDHCVVKIPATDEANHLHKALCMLLADDARRQALGRYAREHVVGNLSPTRFVRELLQFLEEADSLRPQLALTDLVSRELAAMDVAPGAPVLEVVARELEHLWPSEPARLLL
jgi:glycosyltransferase involved in cell wall biosynthesis